MRLRFSLVLALVAACDGAPPRGEPCVVASVTSSIAVTNASRADVLFVVSDAPSMAGEQALLQRELPAMVRLLATGERQGEVLARGFLDLHVGVTSADLGAGGMDDAFAGCRGLGDDGRLLAGDCGGDAPDFLGYHAYPLPPDGGVEPLLEAAGCRGALGSDGCVLVQPLEAALKALWPGAEGVDREGEPIVREPLRFLGDGAGGGREGHGNGTAEGFARNDPTRLSLLEIVVIADTDDCSLADPAALAEGSGSVAERCARGGYALWPIVRYVERLRGLRPGAEQLVELAVIAGFPADLVSEEAQRAVDFSDSMQREAFYDGLLADPRMQPEPDPDANAGLSAACEGNGASAAPAPRLAEAARRFGELGHVGSICGDGFEVGLSRVVAGRIASSLGGVCPPRAYPRDDAGLVPACRAFWELPASGPLPPQTPGDCSERSFLSDVDAAVPVDARGKLCELRQVAVRSEEELDALPADAQGFYYDDFSEERPRRCDVTRSDWMLGFTSQAPMPEGVTAHLVCTDSHAPDGGPALACEPPPPPVAVSQPGTPRGFRTPDVGKRCAVPEVPAGGFDERETYVFANAEDCQSGVCLVDGLNGDPRPGCEDGWISQCDPRMADCVPEARCATPSYAASRIHCSCRCRAPDPDTPTCHCPDGFVCEDRVLGGAAAGGYCVREGNRRRR